MAMDSCFALIVAHQRGIEVIFFSVKLVPANLSSKSKLTNCSLSKVVFIKEANTGLNLKTLA